LSAEPKRYRKETPPSRGHFPLHVHCMGLAHRRDGAVGLDDDDDGHRLDVRHIDCPWVAVKVVRQLPALL